MTLPYDQKSFESSSIDYHQKNSKVTFPKRATYHPYNTSCKLTVVAQCSIKMASVSCCIVLLHPGLAVNTSTSCCSLLVGKASSVHTYTAPPSSPPCCRGNCTQRLNCRQSWVLPAALLPAISVRAGTRIPPRRNESSTGQPTLNLPEKQ